MSEEINSGNPGHSKGIYIFRQILIITAAWTIYFLCGIFFGTPTVLIPQLSEEGNRTITPDEASWLPAVVAFASIPCDFLLPLILALYGRRIAFALLSISALTGHIIFYCSSELNLIIIGSIFQGPLKSAGLNTLIMILSEYPPSEWRGLFLTIKSATFFWGIFVANTMGTFLHWRKIPLFGMILASYSLISVCFWPESPLWLAQNGRFNECAKSHRWLKGSCEKAEQELDKLISDYRRRQKKQSLKCELIDTVKAFTKIEFYKPVLLCALLLASYMFSGKLICTMYAIEILKKITRETSAAYTGMLILDAVTITSMYVGCIFSKMFKRRVWLLTFTLISISFLYIMSLYLFLVNIEVLPHNNVISISLLTAYSVTIGCGPMIMSSTILAEIVPLESRNFSLCLIASSYKIIYGVLIKLSPILFESTGMSGTFLFFGVTSTILIVLLYYYLPETKDKTLLEIAQCIKEGISKKKNEEILPMLQNSLIVEDKKM